MAAIFSNASSMAIGMILMFNQFQSIISKNSMKTDIHNSKLKVKLGRNIHVHHTIKGNNFGNLFFYSFHSFLLHFEVNKLNLVFCQTNDIFISLSFSSVKTCYTNVLNMV